MLTRFRAASILTALTVILLSGTAAIAEPGGIGGIPAPHRTPLRAQPADDAQSSTVTVYIAWPQVHEGVCHYCIIAPGRLAEPANNHPDLCSSCLTADVPSTDEAALPPDVSDHTLRVEEDGAGPSVCSEARLYGTARAGSTVRYLFTGQRTSGQFHHLAGLAVLSFEDCNGRPLARSTDPSGARTLEVRTTQTTCRVLRIDAQTDVTFQLDATNQR
jgi:hypothetical protein